MKFVAIIVAIACAIIGVLYLTGALQLGTSHPGRHVSHFVLFEVLAGLSLVWSRFAGKSTSQIRR